VDLFIKGLLPQDAPGDTGSAVDVFDGIDIDWEYPGQCGNSCEPGVARPEDTRNFTLLLQEFRRQLNEAGQQRRRHFLLTIASGAGPATLAKLELREIARSLDFINVMTYDYHGAWEGSTNFNSPLWPSHRDPSRAQQLSTAETVQAYVAGGVPRHQLVIGVPAYSQGWQGVADVNHGLYQPGTGNPTLIYRQAKALQEAGEFVRVADPRTAGAWLYNPATQVFWTYDDAAVMQAKACFARALGLGGVMMWDLSGDTAEAELTSALHATLSARHPYLACAAAIPAQDLPALSP
jgi:chitinase